MASEDVSLPVFGGVGNREVIGLACSVRQAIRLIKKTIHVPVGFELAVWRRDDFIAELLDVPVGYVFSVSYHYRHSTA